MGKLTFMGKVVLAQAALKIAAPYLDPYITKAIRAFKSASAPNAESPPDAPIKKTTRLNSESREDYFYRQVGNIIDTNDWILFNQFVDYEHPEWDRDFRNQVWLHRRGQQDTVRSDTNLEPIDTSTGDPRALAAILERYCK